MIKSPAPASYADLLEDLKPVLRPALSVVYAAAPGSHAITRPGPHGLELVRQREAS